MYTECSSCHTVFRVTPEQLELAAGKVRCGQCDTVFNAQDSLSEDIPEGAVPFESGPLSEAEATGVVDLGELEVDESLDFEPEDVLAPKDDSTPIDLDELDELESLSELSQQARSEPLDQALDLGGDSFSQPLESADEEPASAKQSGKAESVSGPASLEDATPHFDDTKPVAGLQAEDDSAAYIKGELGEGAGPRRKMTVFWSLLIVLLLIVLAGQLIYFKRADLAKYPAMRPAVAAVCQVVGLFRECNVPEWRDLQAIELMDRDVRSHPDQADALLITATLVNQAAYTQPFPKLELSFFDMNHQLLARRRFEPGEYLLSSVDFEQGMQPSIPVQARLEIVDPGPEAVNFEFNFQ